MYSTYFVTFDWFMMIFAEIFSYVKMAFSFLWTFLWYVYPMRLLMLGGIVFFLIYFFVNLLNRSKVD